MKTPPARTTASTPSPPPTETATGCSATDSVLATVRAHAFGEISETACGSYSWFEFSGITESGDYEHTFTGGAANGCDSTVTLHLTINNSTAGDTTAVVCDSFTWHGVTYTETPETDPTFTFVGGNASGCDSTVTLHLTVNHSTTGDTTAVANESFEWHGIVYTETPETDPTFTILGGNANGCDSTVTLHLTVNHATTGDTTAVACDSFTWHGITYTETPLTNPTFTIENGSVVGSDSIVVLHLTINHSTAGDTTAVACDSFTWHGVTYTETPVTDPTFTMVGGNANGCDSTVTLNLTVNHTSAGDTTAVVCDSFTWHGVTYTETPETDPTFTFVGGNASGCDSTVTLHLTINHATAATDSHEACNAFTWIDGVTYTESPTPPRTSPPAATTSLGTASPTTPPATIPRRSPTSTAATPS